MLTPFRVDTNSLFITERLNTIGYDVRLKAVVADDAGELAQRRRERAGVGRSSSSSLAVSGPTEDDLTRDGGGARARDSARRGRVDRRPHSRALRPPRHDDARYQPPPGDGARAARRRAAQSERHGARLVARERLQARSSLLPGPPREMKPMLEAVIAERLAPRAEGSGLFRRVLKITGRAESDVDAQASPVYTPLDDAGDSDQHDDSRGPRPDRASSDRRRRRTRPTRTSCSTRPCWNCRAMRSDRRSTAPTAGASNSRRRTTCCASTR